LSKWFNVSRTVIREATQILVSKGILDVKHGKRMMIRPPSHELISESVSLTFKRKHISPLDVLELRKVLETEAAALAAERADEKDLEGMEQCLNLMRDHVQEEIGYVEADVRFHTAIFTSARQPAFELVLRSLNDYLEDSRKLSYQGDQATMRALEAHKKIFQAIRNKDSQGARAAMQEHLLQTEHDLRHAIQR
jgi:GntR family transcriptional repressor for pyruvate dehydrogenase complex